MARASAAGGAPASAASTKSVQDADLDRVAAGIRGWDTRVTQLAPGRGHGSVFETVLPSSRLVRIVVDTRAALEALPLARRHEKLFHIGTIFHEADRLLWQGFSVPPNMLMLEEGEVSSSFALPTGSEFLVARLDRERVESLIRLLRGATYERATDRSQLHPQPASVLAELRWQLRVMVHGELSHRVALIDSAEGDLYERVAMMLAAPPVARRPSPQTRRRALRRAEEYMHAYAGERISLVDLCIASECSERTLRQVFHECYGVSPIAFLKRLRLQGLRRDLRDAGPHSTTVLDLALRWGFWHLGHLGRDYKSFFGETPGETLAGARYSDGARARHGSL